MEKKGYLKAGMVVFAVIHTAMAILFVVAAVALICVATNIGFLAVEDGMNEKTAQQLIEAIGLLAAAVVALQIAQTVAEEEVVRDAHISAPTRVRRFLSRFLVVVVVSLSIESLVATFKALHESAAQLTNAAYLVGAIGFLLAGWGLFIWFNRAAEELEPEAMEEAKREDHMFK